MYFVHNSLLPIILIGESGEAGDPDGASQQLDQDGQPKHADDGLEDGSLVTRESAFLEGGGGNEVSAMMWFLFLFGQFAILYFICNTLMLLFHVVCECQKHFSHLFYYYFFLITGYAWLTWRRRRQQSCYRRQ